MKTIYNRHTLIKKCGPKFVDAFQDIMEGRAQYQLTNGWVLDWSTESLHVRTVYKKKRREDIAYVRYKQKVAAEQQTYSLYKVNRRRRKKKWYRKKKK